MARSVDQLSPKAQKVYQDNPDLAAKRAQQAAPAEATPAAATPAATPAGPPGLSMPNLSMPDLGGLGAPQKILLIIGAVIIGFALYGRIYGKPIGVSLSQKGAISGGAAVQSYLDQQNRKLGLIADTIPGRVIRINPGKLGAA